MSCHVLFFPEWSGVKWSEAHAVPCHVTCVSSVEMCPVSGDSIPVRELHIQAKVARSSMDVAQKHINFGQLLTLEAHEKALVINNLSGVPLLFAITKTGTIEKHQSPHITTCPCIFMLFTCTYPSRPMW